MIKQILISILFLFTNLALADNLEYNLTDAINQGDLEQAKELIAKGADVNKEQEPFKQTPIIIAPLRGKAFVKLLLENGADINAKDQDNTTALINACLYGNLEITKYLLSKGADISVINKDDMGVLEAAKLSENQELVDYIKSKMSK